MRRIVVCDDEWEARQQIDIYLQQLKHETNEELEVFYFSSGEELLEHIPDHIDVLLLDIQMSKKTGIDVARELRKKGHGFYLFFITSRVEYALEGYEVHAYAFLRKPIQYSQMKRYLLEVFQNLDREKKSVLILKNGSTNDIIHCHDIIYVEVLKHTTYVITENDKYQYSIPLNIIEKKLISYGFFRIHKSYLINMRKILRIHSNEVIMTNRDTIPISKYRKKEFLNEFSFIVGEKL